MFAFLKLANVSKLHLTLLQFMSNRRNEFLLHSIFGPHDSDAVYLYRITADSLAYTTIIRRPSTAAWNLLISGHDCAKLGVWPPRVRLVAWGALDKVDFVILEYKGFFKTW